MPVWHEKTKQWIDDDKLAVLAITQEQHPDRCRLFAQWQQIDWPILHDPINVMQSEVVPIFTAIDEHGVVQHLRADWKTLEVDFLDRDFAAGTTSANPKSITIANVADARKLAKANGSSVRWRQYGDALSLWEPNRPSSAIQAYQRALELASDDPITLFRLGVNYRRRYESENRQAGDFQQAINAWSKALAARPNQYIWRRRIQQYGPRLDKPYPFYDWIDRANKEIAGRGESPLPLSWQPSGAELASPVRSFTEATGTQHPDPRSEIYKDEDKLVRIETTVVPQQIKANAPVRVHVVLTPEEAQKTHWTNDAGVTQVWVDPPSEWKSSSQSLLSARVEEAETSEPRRFEFELFAPADAKGKVTIPGFALYYVCEGRRGSCLYLRQDFEIDVEVK